MLARIGQCADEDPGALRRLLTDPLLPRQVLDAMTDLGLLAPKDTRWQPGAGE